MNNQTKKPKQGNCVKCELHGQIEMYTGGHVRRCPYRLCPCEECQDHDQVLAISSRERRKRKEMREQRRGEALLSKVMVKKLREKINKRSNEIGGLFDSHPGSAGGEPIVLSSDTEGFPSSDTEGFISDVDDFMEVVHEDVHISDELPDPEVRSASNCKKSKSNSYSRARHRSRSPFSKLLEGSSPIVSPPRRLLTNRTTPSHSTWSPTLSSPSLLSSPSNSVGAFTPKVLKSSPLLVTLDSGEDSEGPSSSSENRITNTNIVSKMKDPEQNRSPLTILKRGCRVLISPEPLAKDRAGHRNRSPFSTGGNSPIFTPPRPLLPNVTTPSTLAWSPTPSSPSLLSSPSNSGGKPSPQVQEKSPVLVTLDSGDSGDDSEGVESIICTPSSVGCKGLPMVGRSDPHVDKKKDFQADELSSIDDLLHDSMEDFESEYNETDFDKKYLTGVDSEEEKLDGVDSRSETDTNNNDLIKINVEHDSEFVNNSDDVSHNVDNDVSKHTQKDEEGSSVTTDISKMSEEMNVAADNQPHQVSPTPRPTRWDELPPGLTISNHPFPLPPIYHVAQISVPQSLRGLLMGRGGHFFRKMKEVSGTFVSLGPVYCTVKGSSGGVEVAMRIIHERLRGWNY